MDGKMEIYIDYNEIDEAVLIHALYHHTTAQGMGHLHDRSMLSLMEVQVELERYAINQGFLYIDYFFGRPLKLNLDTRNKRFKANLYDRDAGAGIAENVVKRLRSIIQKSRDGSANDKGISVN
jgi:hypothetical protein